jgi:hypothetical protein
LGYTFLKILLITFCSLFIFIGIKLFNAGGISSSIGLFFAGIGAFLLVTKLRQLSRFQKMNYDWYRSTYPSYSNRTIRCFRCSGDRILVRNLMNQTYHREHFCGACGATLYYSPEDSVSFIASSSNRGQEISRPRITPVSESKSANRFLNHEPSVFD